MKNHMHMTQDQIDELVEEGVLTLFKKDPNNTMEDDKYKLN